MNSGREVRRGAVDILIGSDASRSGRNCPHARPKITASLLATSCRTPGFPWVHGNRAMRVALISPRNNTPRVFLFLDRSERVGVAPSSTNCRTAGAEHRCRADHPRAARRRAGRDRAGPRDRSLPSRARTPRPRRRLIRSDERRRAASVRSRRCRRPRGGSRWLPSVVARRDGSRASSIRRAATPDRCARSPSRRDAGCR